MDSSQSSLFGYIEDLQDLVLIERPVRRSLKTPEEIERLTVDEELSDIERAVYLLSSGQDIQGTSVVANLPVLIRNNPTETLRRVVPKIREVLHVAGVEMQVTAAYSFLTILHEESLSIYSYWQSFLQIILQNLEHRDPGVSNAWLETLLPVIEALPEETIRHEILNPLVSKGQLSQTVQSRLASCRILGKLANKFEATVIQRDILPLVKSLCQDVEYEVRSCMCRQLEFIAHGIGTELTKTAVLPELVELARDESSSVRLAAFETMVNLLIMLDHGIFTTDQQLWFLEFYRKLCRLGLQEENGQTESLFQATEMEKKYLSVRRNCALNFPAMIVFVGPKNFKPELYSTFVSLCHDPEASVRCTMAIGFYEVTKLLSSSLCLIRKELVALLQDEALEVLDALLDHLPETLELMTSGGENSVSENKSLAVPDLIPALTAAEQRAANTFKWRCHEKLLHKYECLPHVVSSDQIYFRFLQRVFTIVLTTNVLPVQKAAARTLCIFLRYNQKEEQRNEVIQKIIEQLGQGNSYWNRLRFLDTCEFILELFSKAFFCKYFFLSVLELRNDPVANVRMKLCYMLPKLKSTLKLPVDRPLLQQLESCVRKLLCEEKDKDVLDVLNRTVLELDIMETSIDVKRYYENDFADQQKEREEQLLLEMEQIEKEKQQNDGKARNEKNSDKKLASKEVKKKLGRSRSFSSHAVSTKHSTLEKCANKSPGCNSSGIGMGKSVLLPFGDESLKPRTTNSSVTMSFCPTAAIASSSRNSTTADQKSNSKDLQPRRMSLKNRKLNA